MAFTGNYVCNSFKYELMKGLHDFTTSTGHAFKLALYGSSASLTASTSVYTSTGEAPASGGYTATGEALTISASMPTLLGTVAWTDFADALWAASSITARGAMIYNSSASNRSVVILDFNAEKISDAGDFSVIFPPSSATRAVIRIG